MVRISLIHTACSVLLALSLAQTVAAASICNPELATPHAVLDTRVVILGELHGTEETPRFAGEYVCTLASGSAEVVLALEIHDSEQERISKYLESAGSPADVSALLIGDFWRRPVGVQDGRSSKAMFQLIERIRQLRRASKGVSITAMDGQRPGLTRDGAMAQIVREIVKAKPHVRVLALVGNVHSVKDRGAFFDSEYESFGYLLSDLHPLTLNVMPKRGSAWVCMEGCGAKKLTSPASLATIEPGVHLGLNPSTALMHHGTVVLEEARASQPARDDA